MYSSLFWIEWLDRLDRVLTGSRRDVAAHWRVANPRSLEAIARSERQLAALTNDLRLLDRELWDAGADSPSAVDNLQKALDITVLRLGGLAAHYRTSTPALRDAELAATDAALRDSCYEAAMLLAPSRRRAALPAHSARL